MANLSIRERILKGWIPTDADFRKMTVAEVKEASAAFKEAYFRDIEKLLQIGRDAGITFSPKYTNSIKLVAGRWNVKTKQWEEVKNEYSDSSS